tara:strand:+ start:4656 stop:5684 length:1029 start_codon:yes stop_codon:yes gene_type:complete
MSQKILVTGSAGFIGFYVCRKLLEIGFNVIGIDNINSYYDVNLKKKRLDLLSQISLNENTWDFLKADLVEKDNLIKIFEDHEPSIVVNLAAQAGVRYSIENVDAYINSNIVGFSNILECCRNSKVKNLLYASSSSVYGGNTKIPFSEDDPVNHPVSLYAATKRSNELMAHAYSHLYGLSCTGLRFFTVYGPWGRPDMAPMIFADAIINQKPLKIFNHGKMSRSFTYIDDILDVIIKLIDKPAIPDKSFNTNKPNISSSWCSNRIFNIGNDNSIKLIDFISHLEKELGKKAIKEYYPMQQGDVANTLSDNKLISEWIINSPKTSVNEGIKKFINWYKKYYNKN